MCCRSEHSLQYFNNKRLETPNVQLVEYTMVHLQIEKVHHHKKLKADIKKKKGEDTLLRFFPPILYLQNRNPIYSQCDRQALVIV